MVEFKVNGDGQYAEGKANEIGRNIAHSLTGSIRDGSVISVAASAAENFASIALPAGLEHDVSQEVINSIDRKLVAAGLDEVIDISDFQWNRDGSEREGESLDDIIADIPTEGIGEPMENVVEHLMNH